MSSYNESSAGNKYYFEVEWGVPKKLYLEKFLFRSRYAFELNGQRAKPANPVYLYPDVSKYFLTHPLIPVLEEFKETGSRFPRCSIKAEVTVGNRGESIMSYQFRNVRIVELYGKDWSHDRFNVSYVFEFENWSY